MTQLTNTDLLGETWIKGLNVGAGFNERFTIFSIGLGCCESWVTILDKSLTCLQCSGNSLLSLSSPKAHPRFQSQKRPVHTKPRAHKLPIRIDIARYQALPRFGAVVDVIRARVGRRWDDMLSRKSLLSIVSSLGCACGLLSVSQ
jgi:hypothetical protein